MDFLEPVLRFFGWLAWSFSRSYRRFIVISLMVIDVIAAGYFIYAGPAFMIGVCIVVFLILAVLLWSVSGNEPNLPV